jgi:transcriptional regulator with GAF, ATPase, and Fis domain
MVDTTKSDKDRIDEQALDAEQTLKYAEDLVKTYMVLQESEKRYRALWHISKSLYQHMNMDDLILTIITRTSEAINAEALSIFLHDEKTDELVFHQADDQSGVITKHRESRYPLKDGLIDSVLKSGNPEFIPESSGDLSESQKTETSAISGTKPMIVVPLQIKDKTIGVLQAVDKKSGSFDDKDLFFLIILAPMVAMALDNARMYAALDKAYKELQIVDKEKDHLIKHTQKENVRLRQAVEKHYRIEQIIGNSDQMLEVFRLCEKVMDSDITVLVEGETGTGKELIARCIHHNSPRKERPFVTQNCAGIPDTLLASELFGHKRGAFTGAVSDKKGLFEMAHGGTVFLDEVAEMSAAMQSSLLRVLQEGEIKPLGADSSRKVDVRVISATNRDLEEDVKTGRFREDLLYRINVFNIKVPPLRERIGDIPILVKHFIKKYDEKTKKGIQGVSPEALQCFEAYPFPGNVRELENELERAVAMAEPGELIQMAHLSEKMQTKSATVYSGMGVQGTLKQMVEKLEKSVLIETVKNQKGNKTRAAKELGMSRYGLTKKMQRYGL